ncbi:DUF4935 domain-containing protein [Brachyspira aalborgi]|uniref:DUF4935 domain-containing protein n=1 Tax=Brachyspira aalborgi TaxID=29522 RepID=A0A5C8ELC0_9SPIR|nr:PIN domain-containing protein [Brachyspira aalborgi]TXJ37771.1 DUF4935 domain-containing protein [Brachyspira aalborgi]TXJ53305.1 DUF4935 domain-containing protein [Brachyspira aalborgi]TXJ60704.1 DUF4935 domain-containing protein [Brachyspira aalborgi]
MKIFFDTNVFYTDLLFEHPEIKLLLEMSSDNFIEIYISSMVVCELKKKYLQDVKDKIRKINSSLEDLRKLHIVISNIKYERVDIIFTDRIEKIKREYNVNVLEYTNDILEIMINRYFESKAPFHKKSDAWKDYIIWNSYEQIINNSKDEDYIFISNNTNDFASQSNKEELHTDFLVENKNIRYYHFIKDLFEKDDVFKRIREEFEKLRPLKKLKDFIKGKDEINENFIENNFIENIVSAIEEIDFTDEEEIYRMFEYVEVVELRDYIEVNSIDYDIQIEEHTLLVYGNLIITNQIDVYSNNINRESCDDWYELDEAYAKLGMDFSFIISVNENTEDFELSKENISNFELFNIEVIDIIA